MISFVIPAYNEAAVLGETLECVREAARETGREFEVIVVDDASTDDTAAVARAGGARVVPVNRRQIAAARNAGAAAAAGEVLVFVDADTLLPVRTLQAALDALDAGAVGGGCGMVEFDGEVPTYAALMLAPCRIILRVLGVAPGCFLFCTREAFEATGGFDERLYASEECFFSRALRKQGRFVHLREPVVTSGRKLRQYGARQIFGTLGRLMITGGLACRRREGLDLWYDGRRETEPPGPGIVPAAPDPD